MNEIVTNCIEPRKNAVYQMCQDESKKAMVEEYFEKVLDFAKGCSDTADFESKFSMSSLSEEYTELLTKVMTTGDTSVVEESLASEVGKEVVDDIYHGARRKAYQEGYDKVRDIPVVGDVLNIKQHFDFFSRFKKKKDKE